LSSGELTSLTRRIHNMGCAIHQLDDSEKQRKRERGKWNQYSSVNLYFNLPQRHMPRLWHEALLELYNKLITTYLPTLSRNLYQTLFLFADFSIKSNKPEPLCCVCHLKYKLSNEKYNQPVIKICPHLSILREPWYWYWQQRQTPHCQLQQTQSLLCQVSSLSNIDRAYRDSPLT